MNNELSKFQSRHLRLQFIITDSYLTNLRISIVLYLLGFETILILDYFYIPGAFLKERKIIDLKFKSTK